MYQKSCDVRLNWIYHTVTKKWKCLFFTGHLTTHPLCSSLSLTLPRSWLISWRYLVMNRLAVLCGHDDCLARSNFCRIIQHSLRYQISHALRHVLWLQCKPGENWLQKQLSRTLSKRFWQRLLPGIWVFVESEWKKK